MRTKYPRTFHLNWSPGLSGDDKLIPSLDILQSSEIVVTEKLDGENTTIYRDGIHARSTESKHHPSRAWIKIKQSEIGYRIDQNMRICGENVYAKHSIHYQFLTTYFYVFAIYMGNICLSWDDTEEFASMLGLETVPILYRGPWDIKKIKNCWTGKSYFSNNNEFDLQEGYVVRTASAFSFENHSKCIAKFVRENHVQTDSHWLNQQVIPNLLKITDHTI
jgi:hypothetical protein